MSLKPETHLACRKDLQALSSQPAHFGAAPGTRTEVQARAPSSVQEEARGYIDEGTTKVVFIEESATSGGLRQSPCHQVSERNLPGGREQR